MRPRPEGRALQTPPWGGQKALMGALWEATAHRSPMWERTAAACPGRGEAGGEPG